MKCHHKPRTLITGQLERKCIKNSNNKKKKSVIIGTGTMNMVECDMFCVYMKMTTREHDVSHCMLSLCS